MRSIMQRICLGFLFAVAAYGFVASVTHAGEPGRARGKSYSGYSDDSTGLLDAINRDHGTPPRRPYSGIGHGPTGRLEVNPYHPKKWYRNEAGMIDAINRDHPPIYPRQR